MAGDVEIREVAVEEEASKGEAEVAAKDTTVVHSNHHTRKLKILTNRRPPSLWSHHLHQASGRSRYRLSHSSEEHLGLPRLLLPRLLVIRCRVGVQPRATRSPSLPSLHRTGHRRRSSSNDQHSPQVICHQLEGTACLGNTHPTMARLLPLRHKITSIPTTTADRLRTISSSVGDRIPKS